MKNFIATLILIAGLYFLFEAFSMDTSVKVDYSNNESYGMPDRVNNIGLMQEKQNSIIIGSVLTIGGLIIGFMGENKNKE